MSKLYEDNRAQLMAASRSAQKEKDGKTRYQKRLKSSIASSNREYNQIDMNSLFKNNILTVNIPVRGETDNYIVTFSFGGFLDKLHNELERNNEQLQLRVVIRAVIDCFNSDNVYIRCSCEDFHFRFSYWATKTDIITGPKENIPSDITNPSNTLGKGCKHIMLCLANTRWCIKVAAVIKNYIEYMEKHLQSMYAKVIYPAIYKREYEEPVQQTLFDTDELETSTDVIDTASKEARKKGQFQAGNQYRFRKQPDEDQVSIEDVEVEDEVSEE